MFSGNFAISAVLIVFDPKPLGARIKEIILKENSRIPAVTAFDAKRLPRLRGSSVWVSMGPSLVVRSSSPCGKSDVEVLAGLHDAWCIIC